MPFIESEETTNSEHANGQLKDVLQGLLLPRESEPRVLTLNIVELLRPVATSVEDDLPVDALRFWNKKRRGGKFSRPPVIDPAPDEWIDLMLQQSAPVQTHIATALYDVQDLFKRYQLASGNEVSMREMTAANLRNLRPLLEFKQEKLRQRPSPRNAIVALAFDPTFF